MAKALGILGGTFDPIHYGHLRPAQEVLRALDLAEIRVIPAANPPHRRPPVATPEQRLRMVELAVAGVPGFTVDDREFRRGGPSYTVLTLESLRSEFGERPLCLLMGLDAFEGIETWHQWQRLPELAHFIVMTRPGWEFPAGERLPAVGARPRGTRDIEANSNRRWKDLLSGSHATGHFRNADSRGAGARRTGGSVAAVRGA